MKDWKDINRAEVGRLVKYLIENEIDFEVVNGRVYTANGAVRISCFTVHNANYRPGKYYVRYFGATSYVLWDTLIGLIKEAEL